MSGKPNGKGNACLHRQNARTRKKKNNSKWLRRKTTSRTENDKISNLSYTMTLANYCALPHATPVPTICQRKMSRLTSTAISPRLQRILSYFHIDALQIPACFFKTRRASSETFLILVVNNF